MSAWCAHGSCCHGHHDVSNLLLGQMLTISAWAPAPNRAAQTASATHAVAIGHLEELVRQGGDHKSERSGLGDASGRGALAPATTSSTAAAVCHRAPSQRALFSRDGLSAVCDLPWTRQKVFMTTGSGIFANVSSRGLPAARSLCDRPASEGARAGSLPIFTFPDLRDLCERQLQGLASRALALQPWGVRARQRAALSSVAALQLPTRGNR